MYNCLLCYSHKFFSSLLQDEISALQAIYLPEELEVKNAEKRSNLFVV